MMVHWERLRPRPRPYQEAKSLVSLSNSYIWPAREAQGGRGPGCVQKVPQRLPRTHERHQEAQGSPKTLRKAPETPHQKPKQPPRGLPETPWRHPRDPSRRQDSPGRRTGSAPEPPRSPQEAPGDTQKGPRGTHEAIQKPEETIKSKTIEKPQENHHFWCAGAALDPLGRSWARLGRSFRVLVRHDAS